MYEIHLTLLVLCSDMIIKTDKPIICEKLTSNEVIEIT
jgi:hypothetical protein